MLRTRIAQSSRSVASSSSQLHTSAALRIAASKKAKVSPSNRRREETRPHVVLGNRPGDDAKWLGCDLAKILVTEEQLASVDAAPQPVETSSGTIQTPKYFNYGVDESERQMLFQNLPALSAKVDGATTSVLSSWMVTKFAEAEKRELFKSTGFAKILDLRNANAGGIAYENRRRCVAHFSTPDNPHDPGRPEVQAAILTMRIRNIWAHLTKYKRDIGNRRGLRMLVHQRAKILRYLKRVDRERYDSLLPRLGLEPESVEGELIV